MSKGNGTKYPDHGINEPRSAPMGVVCQAKTPEHDLLNKPHYALMLGATPKRELFSEPRYALMGGGCRRKSTARELFSEPRYAPMNGGGQRKIPQLLTLTHINSKISLEDIKKEELDVSNLIHKLSAPLHRRLVTTKPNRQSRAETTKRSVHKLFSKSRQLLTSGARKRKMTQQLTITHLESENSFEDGVKENLNVSDLIHKLSAPLHSKFMTRSHKKQSRVETTRRSVCKRLSYSRYVLMSGGGCLAKTPEHDLVNKPFNTVGSVGNALKTPEHHLLNEPHNALVSEEYRLRTPDRGLHEPHYAPMSGGYTKKTPDRSLHELHYAIMSGGIGMKTPDLDLIEPHYAPMSGGNMMKTPVHSLRELHYAIMNGGNGMKTPQHNLNETHYAAMSGGNTKKTKERGLNNLHYAIMSGGSRKNIPRQLSTTHLNSENRLEDKQMEDPNVSDLIRKLSAPLLHKSVTSNPNTQNRAETTRRSLRKLFSKSRYALKRGGFRKYTPKLYKPNEQGSLRTSGRCLSKTPVTDLASELRNRANTSVEYNYKQETFYSGMSGGCRRTASRHHLLDGTRYALISGGNRMKTPGHGLYGGHKALVTAVCRAKTPERQLFSEPRYARMSEGCRRKRSSETRCRRMSEGFRRKIPRRHLQNEVLNASGRGRCQRKTQNCDMLNPSRYALMSGGIGMTPQHDPLGEPHFALMSGGYRMKTPRLELFRDNRYALMMSEGKSMKIQISNLLNESCNAHTSGEKSLKTSESGSHVHYGSSSSVRHCSNSSGPRGLGHFHQNHSGRFDYEDTIENILSSSDRTADEDLKIRNVESLSSSRRSVVFLPWVKRTDLPDGLRTSLYMECPRRFKLRQRISKRVSKFAEEHRQRTQAFLVSENIFFFFYIYVVFV